MDRQVRMHVLLVAQSATACASNPSPACGNRRNRCNSRFRFSHPGYPAPGRRNGPNSKTFEPSCGGGEGNRPIGQVE